jgi:hypothetical protein
MARNAQRQHFFFFFPKKIKISKKKIKKKNLLTKMMSLGERNGLHIAARSVRASPTGPSHPGTLGHGPLLLPLVLERLDSPELQVTLTALGSLGGRCADPREQAKVVALGGYVWTTLAQQISALLA